MGRHYQLIGRTVVWLMLWHSPTADSAFADFPSPYPIEPQKESDFDTDNKPTPGDESKENSRDEYTSGLDCDSLGEEPKTLAEKLEDLGKLYQNDNHPLMQEWWFLGRYHGQYWNADGGGDQQDDWENRRFRIGSQARFFNKLTIHAQMVSGFDMDPFYNGFTELWSQWSFDDSFMVTVGQQKHRFTHDRNVSSRYINTLERSMLVNMFNADYTPAVTASGKFGKFAYYTGIFSNATGPNIWEALTEYDSGYSFLASGTWDIKDRIDLDEAFFNICYLHSDANQNATNLNRYKDGLSAALIFTEGPGSLVSEALLGMGKTNGQGSVDPPEYNGGEFPEALLGRGSTNGNAFGINIQPGYFLTDKLQIATRYQLAFADKDDGLLAQRRYERTVGVNTGDLYQAGYAGLNYYIAGHRMKLMSGIEYAEMNGQEVWTASMAIRVFWGPESNGPFPMAKTLKPRSR